MGSACPKFSEHHNTSTVSPHPFLGSRPVPVLDSLLHPKPIKILVLGTGNSGKSTIVKQVKILLMDGFSVDELKIHKPNIYESICLSMNMLTKSMKDMDIGYEAPVQRKADAAVSLSASTSGLQRERFSKTLADAIMNLWNDPGLKEAYAEHAESIHLDDGAKQLFDEMERIRAVDYVPSYQDLLDCRTATTGVVTYEFKYSNLQFSMTDLGGVRAARKKWSTFYKAADGIIFVVALSEYDLTMIEDEGTNRMNDSLEAFGELINNPDITDHPIILLFTKQDLFREKLSKVPLTVVFPHYHGGTDVFVAEEFVSQEFLKQAKGRATTTKRRGTIYPYFTEATKTDAIKEVIEAFLDVLKTKVLYSTDVWEHMPAL